MSKNIDRYVTQTDSLAFVQKLHSYEWNVKELHWTANNCMQRVYC